jgi:hypothetical protein
VAFLYGRPPVTADEVPARVLGGSLVIGYEKACYMLEFGRCLITIGLYCWEMV